MIMRGRKVGERRGYFEIRWDKWRKRRTEEEGGSAKRVEVGGDREGGRKKGRKREDR